MNSVPAQTRHSLLASATVAPRATAASVGRSPAAPVIAAITQSAGRCSSLDDRIRARGRLDPGSGERVLEFGITFRVGDAATRASSSRASLASALAFFGSGDRLDPIAARLALEQIDRAGADRAGRTETP